MTLGETRYPRRARAEPSQSNLSVSVAVNGVPTRLTPVATDEEPLIGALDRSISSPPTTLPACQLAPAWKPPTKPCDLMPVKKTGATVADAPLIRSSKGSRPQP